MFAVVITAILVGTSVFGVTYYTIRPTTSSTVATGRVTSTTTGLESISIGVSSPLGTFAALWVADLQGFMKEQGLKPEYALVGGAPLVDGLVKGQFLGIWVGAGPTVLPTYVQGLKIKALMSILYGPSAGWVVVSKTLWDSGKVKKMSDLEGMRVASQNPPSYIWAVANLYKKVYNVNYTLVPLNGITNLVGALHTGQVAALVGVGSDIAGASLAAGDSVVLVNATMQTGADWASQLRVAGYKVESGASVISTALLTSEQAIEKQPNTVQRYVNAINKANYWIRTHTLDEVFAVVVNHPFLKDVPREATYTGVYFVMRNLPLTGYISKADWDATIYLTVLATPDLAPNQSKLIADSYNDLVDMTFWKNTSWQFNQANW